ncbi:hypothetical protein C8N40_111109 [Pontibacter mucosus]|uniref:Uncharacterized protein n=1 Tax=Pontibacter mucosus TaxID=1649266 RepID=A0A2T5YD60_9BACT|nr:hypothetical protein C8N40_111109 [Pontibacter mucosus]
MSIHLDHDFVLRCIRNQKNNPRHYAQLSNLVLAYGRKCSFKYADYYMAAQKELMKISKTWSD